MSDLTGVYAGEVTAVAITMGRWRVDAVRHPSTPTGLAIGGGAAAMVAAGIVAALIPATEPDWRFAVMAIAVGLFGAISLDQVALAAVAVLAFAISNGFLEDRLGQLSWHGSGDVWRVLLLVMAAAWGLAVGEVVRFVVNLRRRYLAEPVRAPDEAVDEDDITGRSAEDPLSGPWSASNAIGYRFGIFMPDPMPDFRDGPGAVRSGMFGDAPAIDHGSAGGHGEQLAAGSHRDLPAAPDERSARQSGGSAMEGPAVRDADRPITKEEKHGA